MVANDTADKLLFESAQKGLNRLLCGYAVPNMVSWYVKSLQERLLMNFSRRSMVKQNG